MSAAEEREASIGPTMLTLDQILEANDLARELVDVPEWGGAVYVQALSGIERDAWEESIIEIRGSGKNTTTKAVLTNMRAKLCARCIVDEHGERLFSDVDVEALGKKSAGALDRVFAIAQKKSGLSEGDVDELVGN